MLTMGIDIGSRSSKCVILEDGKLLTYGTIETGPNIHKTAQAVVEAAIHRRAGKWGDYRMPLPETKADHLKIEDMAYVVATGYGRAIVPFAHRHVTEITCHCRGAQWFVPGDLLLCGGVVRNAGIVKAIEAHLGKPALVPKQPQYVRALGAAVFARQMEREGGASC